ncbi:MAG: hypothetical protein ACUVRY_00805 [Thermoanaerobaculaceae bacterium]
MKTRLLVVGVIVIPFLLGAAPPKRAKPAHPKVGQEESCDTCHKEVTPKVVEAWHQSPHGLNNVKCFVCHGSVEQDFTLRAPVTRCVGCHGDEVEAMTNPFFAGKDCFSCHSGHELNPHKIGGGQ